MRVLHIVVNVLDCVTVFFFFFNDTATTEIYTLSLHDALPIYYKTIKSRAGRAVCGLSMGGGHTFGISRLYPTEFDYYGLFSAGLGIGRRMDMRSEEHTSELQSRQYLVCRLLLEKKKITKVLYNE